MVVNIGGKKLLLVHGHRHSVDNGIHRLYYYAMEKKADCALFGHTHIPEIIREGDLFIMNPGSPSFPRGGFTQGTYGILHIGDKITGEIKGIM